jgi:AmmeMemoRadiSam system protein A
MNDTLGRALLVRARNAIAGEFGLPGEPEPASDGLATPGAVFVTLTQQGDLRGCIGSLEAFRPLEDDVRANARAAAFRDPRFPPLSRAELAATRIEVSLLTPATPMRFANEEDAISQLRPGVDGVILECAGRRGTFLPQVWDSLPERHLFLNHLKRKAGLAPDYWAPGIRLSRYEVKKWKEPEKS